MANEQKDRVVSLWSNKWCINHPEYHQLTILAVNLTFSPPAPPAVGRYSSINQAMAGPWPRPWDVDLSKAVVPILAVASCLIVVVRSCCESVLGSKRFGRDHVHKVNMNVNKNRKWIKKIKISNPQWFDKSRNKNSNLCNCQCNFYHHYRVHLCTVRVCVYNIWHEYCSETKNIILGSHKSSILVGRFSWYNAIGSDLRQPTCKDHDSLAARAMEKYPWLMKVCVFEC